MILIKKYSNTLYVARGNTSKFKSSFKKVGFKWAKKLKGGPAYVIRAYGMNDIISVYQYLKTLIINEDILVDFDKKRLNSTLNMNQNFYPNKKIKIDISKHLPDEELKLNDQDINQNEPIDDPNDDINQNEPIDDPIDDINQNEPNDVVNLNRENVNIQDEIDRYIESMYMLENIIMLQLFIMFVIGFIIRCKKDYDNGCFWTYFSTLDYYYNNFTEIAFSLYSNTTTSSLLLDYNNNLNNATFSYYLVD
jgi:hypothetical protein